MSGNKYGMVIDFDSLTALLDILMDAGYKGDENARLLYLSITEAELFDHYLREKEQRENGLKNFMPVEPSKLKPREPSKLKPREGYKTGRTSFKNLHMFEPPCTHETRMTNILTGRVFCMDCKVEIKGESLYFSNNLPDFTNWSPETCTHDVTIEHFNGREECVWCYMLMEGYGKLVGWFIVDGVMLEKCF